MRKSNRLAMLSLYPLIPRLSRSRRTGRGQTAANVDSAPARGHNDANDFIEKPVTQCYRQPPQGALLRFPRLMLERTPEAFQVAEQTIQRPRLQGFAGSPTASRASGPSPAAGGAFTNSTAAGEQVITWQVHRGRLAGQQIASAAPSATQPG
jgi:hypothetical protein